MPLFFPAAPERGVLITSYYNIFPASVTCPISIKYFIYKFMPNSYPARLQKRSEVETRYSQPLRCSIPAKPTTGAQVGPLLPESGSHLQLTVSPSAATAAQVGAHTRPLSGVTLSPLLTLLLTRIFGLNVKDPTSFTFLLIWD